LPQWFLSDGLWRVRVLAWLGRELALAGELWGWESSKAGAGLLQLLRGQS